MICLRDILPMKHLDVWSIFVKGCFLICKRCITMNDADQAHELFKMFCCQFELLYGHKFCVPNMHLMLHLNDDCIKDYGSVYGLWCFSFERYDGLMSKCQTNNSSIELQVMRTSISSKQVQVNHTLRDCADDDKGDYDTYYKFRDLRCQVKFGTLSSPTELRVFI